MVERDLAAAEAVVLQHLRLDAGGMQGTGDLVVGNLEGLVVADKERLAPEAQHLFRAPFEQMLFHAEASAPELECRVGPDWECVVVFHFSVMSMNEPSLNS